jgi:hypothetical protein
MKYYFDESGDWSFSFLVDVKNDWMKKKPFILSGIVIQDKYVNEISFTLKEFKKVNGINNLHGSENSPAIKQSLYSLIAGLLEKGKIKSCVKLYGFKYLQNRLSSYEPDDLYMDEASIFCQKFIIGDNEPTICWDPKFKYSYLSEVINNSAYPERWEKKVVDIYNEYDLKEEIAENKHHELIKKMENKINAGRIETEFLQKLRTLEGKKEIRKIIKRFDFSYLDLHLAKTLSMREKFNQKIEDAYLNNTKLLSMPVSKKNKIRVNYIDKYSGGGDTFGIEITDAISNLFYSSGKNLPPNPSSALKTIYSYTQVEVTDER